MACDAGDSNSRVSQVLAEQVPMSSGWHQLPRDDDNVDGDGDEEEEDEEEEGEAYESGDEQDDENDHEGDDGGDDEDEALLDGASERHDNGEDKENHIDIDDRADSFWDHDDSSPNQFQPPHYEQDLSIINVLAEQIQQQEIPSYLDQFEILVPDAELIVGAVPLEDIQQREREIEQAKIRHQQLEVEVFRQRETQLAQRVAHARDELKREAARKQRQLDQQKRQFAQTVRLQSQRLGYVFQQAESRLKATLRRQQARVNEVFGRLEPSSLPSERRRYHVEWDQIPVTVKVRVMMLRALKDKLPRGQYALLATLYDRLGGHALHWTAWDPEEKPRITKRRPRPSTTASTELVPEREEIERAQRPNVTRPFRHRGRFFSTDVVIDQDMYVVCPPQSRLRPGNVLVFELFLLETSTVRPRNGGHQVLDQIVAWGVMPLMTPEFTYVDGKFKIPFLKGEMDATMDKFRDIEDMYTRDLSAWLCNLYLHVTPMKDEMERVLFGNVQAEERYDVEIDQRNAGYRLPPGSVDETKSSNTQLRIRKKSHVVSPADSGECVVDGTVPSTSATLLLDDGDGDAKKERRSKGFLGFWKTKKKSNRVYAGSIVMPELQEAKDEGTDEEKPPVPSPKLVHQTSDRNDHPAASPSVSQRRLLPSTSTRSVRDSLNDDDADEDDAIGVLDTENYRFSINGAFTRESAHHVRFHAARKLQYLRHELFVDMGITRRALRQMDFWLLVLMLGLALWLRVYVHYLAQWLFLKAQRVAVFFFRPQWTTCMIKYTWRSVATHTEIGVIIAGVLGNWALFAFLAIAAAVSQAHVGELPAFGSKFLVCVGFATLLDPFLIFAVDLVHRQYDCGSRPECLVSLSSPSCKCVDGDAFKLYTRFLAQEGSGLVGIAVTAIVYAALTSLSMVAFYMYLLHVHMNGRMLDVYRRIHAQDAELFLPHDCEVPLQELKAICDYAARWKGPRGTQRKVFVHDYVLEDPLDPTFQEKSTHIAIYTVGLDGVNGPRELYRHFLKSPDGAIIELFGQLDASNSHPSAWQRDAAPSVVSSLALLHNILQDHRRSTPDTVDYDVMKVLNGRQD